MSLRYEVSPEHELAFVRYNHATIPEAERQVACGGILNFEFPDAVAEWERLRDAGAPVLLPLRDEAFGQRHFIVEGPGRVMIDVGQVIPPRPEFARAYASA